MGIVVGRQMAAVETNHPQWSGTRGMADEQIFVVEVDVNVSDRVTVAADSRDATEPTGNPIVRLPWFVGSGVVVDVADSGDISRGCLSHGQNCWFLACAESASTGRSVK